MLIALLSGICGKGRDKPSPPKVTTWGTRYRESFYNLAEIPALLTNHASRRFTHDKQIRPHRWPGSRKRRILRQLSEDAPQNRRRGGGSGVRITRSFPNVVALAARELLAAP